ncbi:dienelactone hydrolase family protein [Sphingomicrobium sediminis]|uniref:Dienelactone hydrolase family protein n=1 Tax=Sphingomicrobium sediminis TaxID=2950949 RepID=A0A9X2J4Z9_9SPHN|nr:dienelactone hydrolase family protein [Sphingomicrobium sediminis]MCM8557727.1 dienelactone hydrolase family protein [Sphingomicrobium sediminis]
MNHTELTQTHDGTELVHLAMDDGSGVARPGVVILPSFLNRGPVEIDHGHRLVDLGYSVLAADTFGKDMHGLDGGNEEDRGRAFEEMNKRLEDRGAYVKQQQAILDFAKGLDSVDETKVAVMGFCFGGLCTLDLARSGADFEVAASFHGLLKIPNFATQKVKPKVAVYHGWDDPMAPPADVVALGQELTEQGACDWQIHAYGGVGHAFTNPDAGKLEIDGVSHDANAAKRSWNSFVDLLEATLRR